MKTLYLDCGMGAAGDMLAAALLELLPDPAAFVETLRGLGLPGVSFTLEKSVKCGITGSHLAVTVAGQEEGRSIPTAMTTMGIAMSTGISMTSATWWRTICSCRRRWGGYFGGV